MVIVLPLSLPFPLSFLFFEKASAVCVNVVVVVANVATTNVAAIKIADIARVVLVFFVLLIRYQPHYDLICIFDLSNLLLIYLI
jgi:hypothetical protein